MANHNLGLHSSNSLLREFSPSSNQLCRSFTHVRRLVVHFELVTETSAGPALTSGGDVATGAHHHDLFPGVVASIIRRIARIDGFALSLTRGSWDYSALGQQPAAAPAGAELVAWMRRGDTSTEEAGAWNTLVGALSTSTCASLGLMTPENRVVSNPAVYPNVGECRVNTSTNTATPPRVSVGVLPREQVCVENLTPWIKLLPCKAAVGVAAALRGGLVFRGEFLSIQTRVTVVPSATDGGDDDDGGGGGYGGKFNTTAVFTCGAAARLRLVQSLTVVMPTPRHSPWSLVRDVLGITDALRPCPLARKSAVTLDLRDAPIGMSVVGTDTSSSRVVRYDLCGDERDLEANDGSEPVARQCGVLLRPLDTMIGSSLSKSEDDGNTTDTGSKQQWADGCVMKAPFVINVAVLAVGRAGGTIAAIVRSRLDASVDMRLTFMLPWQLRVYTHTLRAKGAVVVPPDGPIRSVENHDSAVPTEAVVWTRTYSPSYDGESMGLWELGLSLPSRTNETESEVELRFDFIPASLHMSQFPPDPNRGIAVPAVVLSGSWIENNTDDARSVGRGGGGGGHHHHARVYSDQLSVLVPHPDFSMPFNVIALTSTVLAGAFGLWIQLATRPLVEESSSGTDTLVHSTTQ